MSEKKPLPEALPPGFSPGRAIELGATRSQLRGQRFLHLAHGKYAVRDDIADQADAIRALMATLPAGATVSHVSALRLLRCPLPWDMRDDGSLHVTVPFGRSYPRVSRVVAHSRILLPGDRQTLEGIPVTTGARTFLDLAAEASDESLVVIGDALINREWTTVDELRARTEAAYRRRGARLARITVSMLDGGAHSAPESVLRYRIVIAGMPTPTAQHPVYDCAGDLIGHVDLGWPELQVAVEYEGRQHADDGQFGYDVERYSRLAAAGWFVLRASRADLRDGSRRFLALLNRTLESRRRC